MNWSLRCTALYSRPILTRYIHYERASFEYVFTKFSLDAVLLGGGLDSGRRGIVEHPQTNPPTPGTLQAGLQEQNGQECDK